MYLLVIVSLIWGLSFNLFKQHLVVLDSNFAAWARMALALPVFLVFLRFREIRRDHALRLMAIGAVQYGLMYVTLNFSFRYLEGWQVALFTIFTPLYVTLINDALARRFDAIGLIAALIVVAGAAIIKFKGEAWDALLTGFLVMQVSNIAFALGQVEYRRLYSQLSSRPHREIYGYLYAGAFLITALATTASGGWSSFALLTPERGLVLLYMGVVASGLCFFWWNKGSTQVSAPLLAAMNNAKIPLAVLFGLTFFNEKADLPRLIVGGGLMILAVALLQARHYARRTPYQA